MLRSLRDIMDYDVDAAGDSGGRVYDALLDERSWRVVHFVIDTRKWLPGEKVLVAPVSVADADGEDRKLRLRTNREQLENSPSIDRDPPVGEQKRRELVEAWGGWPLYWVVDAPGATPPPVHLLEAVRRSKPPSADDPDSDSDERVLRSAEELRGYRVLRDEQEFGHLHDLIVDDEDWSLPSVVVDLDDDSRRIILPCRRVEEIRWSARRMVVDVDERSIADAPNFDPSQAVNTKVEQRRYDYRGRARGSG